jgi:tetratricopeptide (TPR) repeat protein
MATYWKELLQQKTTQDFLGREQEIEFFKTLLDDEPKYLIAHFFGVGGVGKTALLNRFESIANKREVVVARVNETQKSLFEILEKFRQDIEQANHGLNHFAQAYESTQSLLYDLNTNPEFAKVLLEISGRVYSLPGPAQPDSEQSDPESIARRDHLKQMLSNHQRRLQKREEQKALEGLRTPPEIDIEIEDLKAKIKKVSADLAEFSQQLNEAPQVDFHLDPSQLLKMQDNFHFSQFINHYIDNPDQQSLLLNTEEKLTAAFIHDLAQITPQQHILLLFDTWEVLAEFADQWLGQTFISHLLESIGANITIIVAGRERLNPTKQPYARLIKQIELAPFSSEEVRAFLSNRGIVDAATVQAIQTLSRNLPYMLDLVSTGPTAKIDKLSATRDVIELFLKRIPPDEPIKREAIILCAFPRFYDEGIIAHLVPGEDAQELFGWLCKFSFAHGHTERWQYQRIVRSLMLQHRLDQNQSLFFTIHEKLATYFQDRLNQLEPGGQPRFDHPEWQILKLEWLYHQLCQNRGFETFVTLFLKTFRLSSFAKALIDTFLATQEDLRKRSSFYDWVPLFKAAPITDNTLDFSNPKWAPIFERLTRYDGLTDPHLCAFVYYQLGYFYAIDKRDLPAENSYRQAIKLEPSYVSPHNSLALLLELTNRPAEAEKLYRHCLELKPDYLLPYHHLGRLLHQLNRPDDAETIYRQALTIDDVTLQPVSYLHYGNFLNQLNRHTDAEEMYRKALELNPYYVEAYLSLGDLLEKTKQHAELQTIYNQATQLAPDNYLAHLKLGTLQAHTGQTKAAIATFYRCLDIDETRPNAYIPLARQLAADGQTQAALTTYQRVDEIIPANPALKFVVAELYETLDQYDEAIIWYEAYLDLVPDDSNTHQHLIKIKGNH